MPQVRTGGAGGGSGGFTGAAPIASCFQRVGLEAPFPSGGSWRIASRTVCTPARSGRAPAISVPARASARARPAGSCCTPMSTSNGISLAPLAAAIASNSFVTIVLMSSGSLAPAA